MDLLTAGDSFLNAGNYSTVPLLSTVALKILQLRLNVMLSLSLISYLYFTTSVHPADQLEGIACCRLRVPLLLCLMSPISAAPVS